MRVKLLSCTFVRLNSFDSAWNTYLDPEASKEIEVDRQISLRHILVVILIP